LDHSYFASWEVGKALRSGEVIAQLGDYDQNGGWPPHLHFQLIKNIGDWKGDFPGVCSSDDLEQYLENCPDPSHWIKM
jgi:murein DD-endopeptidase MepM/ murein hydrolase activator NlpD